MLSQEVLISQEVISLIPAYSWESMSKFREIGQGWSSGSSTMMEALIEKLPLTGIKPSEWFQAAVLERLTD